MVVFTLSSLVKFYFNEFVFIAKKINCLFYFIKNELELSIKLILYSILYSIISLKQ